MEQRGQQDGVSVRDTDPTALWKKRSWTRSPPSTFCGQIELAGLIGRDDDGDLLRPEETRQPRRRGVAGAGGPALGFAPEQEALPDDIALAYSSVLKAPPVKTASFEQRWTAWGGAYGGSNRTTGDPVVVGSHDLSARAAGFAAGLDYRLTPDTVVGFALAGGSTNWSLAQGLGGGRSDAFQAGVYGATRAGQAYLAAAFSYTNHWMSTDRFAFAGDHLTASFNAQSFGARVKAAIASPRSSAGSRLTPRSRRRTSAPRATARPMPAAAALRSPTMRAPAPTRAAN